MLKVYHTCGTMQRMDTKKFPTLMVTMWLRQVPSLTSVRFCVIVLILKSGCTSFSTLNYRCFFKRKTPGSCEPRGTLEETSVKKLATAITSEIIV